MKKAGIYRTPTAGTVEKLVPEQAAFAAKPGGLGKDDNAFRHKFFPARRVALQRTTACVAPLGKAASLAGRARPVGSSHCNAMPVEGVR